MADKTSAELKRVDMVDAPLVKGDLIPITLLVGKDQRFQNIEPVPVFPNYNFMVKSVIIYNPTANTGTIYVGSIGKANMPLLPGQSMVIDNVRLNRIGIRITGQATGDTCEILALGHHAD